MTSKASSWDRISLEHLVVPFLLMAAGLGVLRVSAAPAQAEGTSEEEYVEPAWLAGTRQYLLIQDYKEGKKHGNRLAMLERSEEDLGAILELGRAILAEERVDGPSIKAILAMLRRTAPSPEITEFVEEFLSKGLRGKEIAREHYVAMQIAIGTLKAQRSDQAFAVLHKVAGDEFWRDRAWASLDRKYESAGETTEELVLKLRGAAVWVLATGWHEAAEPVIQELARGAEHGTPYASAIERSLEFLGKLKRGESVAEYFPVP